MSPGKKLSFLSSLAALAVLVLVTGCGNKPQSSSTPVASPASNGGGASAGNDEAARRFLTTLEAQTFEQRMSYVNTHQAEAYQVAQSKDPAITSRYSKLMTPPQQLPPPGANKK